MLHEIRCDAFKSYGKPRPPIVFHDGLNTVLGDVSGSNSIGKSTFLLIVDFVFGGDDYANSDAAHKVGNHTIQFSFDFSDGRHYYSRNVLEPDIVAICNSNYATLNTIKISEFREHLSGLYQIKQTISFRDVVGRYFRIYGRENDDQNHPLHVVHAESSETAIAALLKLFGVYGRLSEYTRIKKERETKSNAFKDARKYEFVPFSITTKKQFTENEKQIAELKIELEQLTFQTDRNLSEEDLRQADTAADIKGRLAYMRRQRGRLLSQLQTVKVNMAQGVVPSAGDLKALASFFPNINMRKITEIESFHAKMHTILSSELDQERIRIESLISSLDSEIRCMEDEQRKLGVPAKLSKAFLEKYSELNGKIRAFEKQNEAYLQQKALRDEVQVAADRLAEVQDKELRFLDGTINEEMVRLNDFIYDGTHKAPILALDSIKKYTFETPDDTGTGTQFKSLVVFDLAVLKLTELPALVHDSMILKNIGDQPMEKIVELYQKSSKQIFIAMDKDTSYTERTSEILKGTTVLYLSEHGNELFGRAWNRKDEQGINSLPSEGE